jgi:two-component system sensor histidine kinase YesM
LVHEVYEVNLQKNQLAMRQKEIKLKMLASQINPHFLFNSLEAIRMRVYCNGDNETAEVIMLLGKIMRKILEIGNDSILFVDEIDLVKSYLEIHKFRFTNRFNYKIDYDCKLANYKMLPFIIQPVIENAVIHGLKLVEEGGIISLTAKKNDGITTIIVEDNGGGINEERLIYVLNSLNEAEESGQRIGLRNVYQRIKLFYGEAGMNINSEPGKGTRVEITLPGER